MHRARKRRAYTRMPGVHVHPHDVHGGPRLDVVAGANGETHGVCVKMPVWVFMSIHVCAECSCRFMSDRGVDGPSCTFMFMSDRQCRLLFMHIRV